MIFKISLAEILFIEGDNAIYKEIDLSDKRTTSSERVVVQMNKRCNFRVYFDNKVGRVDHKQSQSILDYK